MRLSAEVARHHRRMWSGQSTGEDDNDQTVQGPVSSAARDRVDEIATNIGTARWSSAPKVSQEYRDERRAHILAAARRCFVRDGFHQTSMQDLVSEAGLSSGAVYRYFPSKDAMIEAIAEQNLEEVTAVLRDSLASGLSVGEAMASVLYHVGARHAEDDFAAIAVLVWSEALRNPALAARLRASNEAAVRALIARTQPAGPHQPSPEALADLLLCVLPGYLMQLAIRGPSAVEAIAGELGARGHAEQRPGLSPSCESSDLKMDLRQLKRLSRPSETASMRCNDLVDERLCAEHDCEGEALGVFGLGFGGVDHDAGGTCSRSTNTSMLTTAPVSARAAKPGRPDHRSTKQAIGCAAALDVSHDLITGRSRYDACSPPLIKVVCPL